ncbi:hypothetical protein K523DRAFT_238042 [Schizophyllum commune Tattone D]|nr:hypothetical protein K523DRAFT_238042 [Schizophyllum commune Tattone D]
MEWSPQPLPSSDSSTIDQLHLQPPSLSAYNSVYEAERNCTAKLEAADVLPPTVRRPETERIYLRVVGWLFVFAPRPECHSTLSRWMTACENDTTAIVHLGRSLCNSYLRLSRSSSGFQSPDSRDSSNCDYRGESAETPFSLRNKKEAKQRALERDNYQCVFTKRFSNDSPLYAMPTNPSVKKAIIDAATGFPRGMTREAVEQDPILANGIIVYVAHILGDAFNCDYGSPRTDDEENQRGLPSSPWDLLAAFGYPEIREELEGPRIHRIENLFSVASSQQIWLESMRAWIEPVGHNKYKIDGVVPYKRFFESQLYSPNGIVEFSSRRTSSYEDAQAQPYPLPFSKYFELRAAACKVANLSGAVNLLERVDTALEEADTLAEDGSHADVLEARLLQVAMTRASF